MWTNSLHSLRPLKICLVDKLPAQRGAAAADTAVKRFGSTGALLCRCQEPDYSIQFFSCSQSDQRAPRAEPHSNLSIPDTGINNAAASQRWCAEGQRKSNLLYWHPQVFTTSNPAAWFGGIGRWFQSSNSVFNADAHILKL